MLPLCRCRRRWREEGRAGIETWIPPAVKVNRWKHSICDVKKSKKPTALAAQIELLVVHLFNSPAKQWQKPTAHLFTFSQGCVGRCRGVKTDWFSFKAFKTPLWRLFYCEDKSCFWSVCVLRLGMLSDDSVPQADSVLAALTKHLEVKLAFSETQAHFMTYYIYKNMST